MYGVALPAFLAFPGVVRAIKRATGGPKDHDKRIAFYERQVKAARAAAKRARSLGLRKVADKHEATALKYEQLIAEIVRTGGSRPGVPTTGIRAGGMLSMQIPVGKQPGGFRPGGAGAGAGGGFDIALPDAQTDGSMTSAETAMTPLYARPGFLLLGALAAGGVGYYFYKRNKRKS